MIRLAYSGKHRRADFGRALARLILATSIAGGAAFLVGDGSVASAAREALGATSAITTHTVASHPITE